MVEVDGVPRVKKKSLIEFVRWDRMVGSSLVGMEVRIAYNSGRWTSQSRLSQSSFSEDSNFKGYT